jgi:hypothetical protein
MPRPPGPAQADGAAKCFFRPSLKAFASQGALLLQVFANGDQLAITDALVSLLPVRNGANRQRIPHRDEAAAWRHQRIVAKRKVGIHAGPVVSLRLRDHR